MTPLLFSRQVDGPTPGISIMGDAQGKVPLVRPDITLGDLVHDSRESFRFRIGVHGGFEGNDCDQPVSFGEPQLEFLQDGIVCLRPTILAQVAQAKHRKYLGAKNPAAGVPNQLLVIVPEFRLQGPPQMFYHPCQSGGVVWWCPGLEPQQRLQHIFFDASWSQDGDGEAALNAVAG